jgi:hypothetical protein
MSDLLQVVGQPIVIVGVTLCFAVCPAVAVWLHDARNRALMAAISAMAIAATICAGLAFTALAPFAKPSAALLIAGTYAATLALLSAEGRAGRPMSRVTYSVLVVPQALLVVAGTATVVVNVAHAFDTADTDPGGVILYLFGPVVIAIGVATAAAVPIFGLLAFWPLYAVRHRQIRALEAVELGSLADPWDERV